jgi:diaphanous 1
VTYSLYTNSHKLRALVADVLAALCVLSAKEGHRLVLHAFADFRVAYSEDARFEYLVQSISVRDDDDQSEEIEQEVDEPLLWEYRAAGLALINSIVNTPDDLDERISLRDEFTRRGLNESMVASPPRNTLAVCTTKTRLILYCLADLEIPESSRCTVNTAYCIP